MDTREQRDVLCAANELCSPATLFLGPRCSDGWFWHGCDSWVHQSLKGNSAKCLDTPGRSWSDKTNEKDVPVCAEGLWEGDVGLWNMSSKLTSNFQWKCLRSCHFLTGISVGHEVEIGLVWSNFYHLIPTTIQMRWIQVLSSFGRRGIWGFERSTDLSRGAQLIRVTPRFRLTVADSRTKCQVFVPYHFLMCQFY